MVSLLKSPAHDHFYRNVMQYPISMGKGLRFKQESRDTSVCAQLGEPFSQTKPEGWKTPSISAVQSFGTSRQRLLLLMT